LIQVDHLSVVFRNGGRMVKAVDDVSFEVQHGETFGIVGESGSGKSTILKAIVGLVKPENPSLLIDSKPLGNERTKSDRKMMQFVFQDPYGSLHPRQTIDDILREPLLIHGSQNIDDQVREALLSVGLELIHRFRYPHQLSGGQRQRVAIARALMLKPRILLLDEPTSALDVSIQAEILNLLVRLRENYGFTGILVSHDLGVVAHLCSQIAIMQHGRLVEIVTSEALRSGVVTTEYTRELLVASRGYSR